MTEWFWLEYFVECQPEYRVPNAQNMNPPIAQKFNKFFISNLFNNRRDILIELDMIDKPQFISNMDENVVVFVHIISKVVQQWTVINDAKS